jgi:hypothetical protein
VHFAKIGLLSIRAVDSLPTTGRTTLITIGQRVPHSRLIGLQPTVWLHKTGLTVVRAAWGRGDSGGAAYTNVTNGPYAAMGIMIGGQGFADSVCTGATCKFFFFAMGQD